MILDDDLGFCMWLGRELHKAGMRALPACRSEEALEISAGASPPVDVVIVNPYMNGCRDVIAKHASAKVIAIGGPGKLSVNGLLRRPRGKVPPAADRYVKIVTEVLNTGHA